jgi:CRISPR-associated endonuclease/helicase Cas3
MSPDSDSGSTPSPGLTFSGIPGGTRAIWAKSGSPFGHGLLAHMLDVAAVAERLLLRESRQTRDWAAAAFGLSEPALPRWLAALVGLHDFGKAIPGFQGKWPAGQAADEQAGLSFRTGALSVTRHDLASAALLRRVLSKRFSGAGWIAAVTQALAAHHGYAPRATDILQAMPRNEGPAWKDAREALFDAYWQTLAPPGEPSATLDLPAAAWLAGLTSVCDWIGSNPTWFPPEERDETLVGHHRRALELAEAALDDIGWPHFACLLKEPADTDRLISQTLGKPGVAARPLQRAADRLLAEVREPVLLIVEAPMGEGKTELAFLAQLRLQQAHGHRGMYVALPTQATGNAMFERTVAFLGAFAPGAHLDIQLAHGASMLNERVHRLREVDGSLREAVAASTWFSQRKRPLLSPYGVGTVDQALFATLNVKHHFVRIWGLANRVVVLDEIHAYDTYTSGLIDALLRWLKALNCSVVLMSATLPDARRRALMNVWGASESPDIAYPRVLLLQGDRAIGEHVRCRALEPIRVSGVAEDVRDLAKSALSALDAGGCGAIVVNTVQRAQELYLLLKGCVPGDAELLLFHARYPADERSRIEQAVLQRFGRDARAGRPKRALLVATQVVEQSLDVDFDFMLSDLAPIDLLLQRAGRLHRHERERPEGHREPRLVVAGLLPDREPELKQSKWGFVYHPYVLYRTWAVARHNSTWHLPADIDRLVQAVYGGEAAELDVPEGFVRQLDVALGSHLAELQRQRQLARNVAIDARAEPQNAYADKPRANEEGDGDGIRVTTRLGDDSVSVVPILEDASGWRLLPEDEPFDPALEIADELAHRIVRRQVRLSRKDVLQALAAVPLPGGFEAHPLLRNLRPLRLRDGVADFGRLRVRLDQEIGVIYESVEA